MTETTNNILGKHRPAKKPWVTDDILKLCDKRRELKQKKNTTGGAQLHREANQQVKKKGMRKAKETWIEEQCQGIEENLHKNNSKKACQLVKEHTCVCTHTTTEDPSMLDVPPPINNDSYPILREEVEAAVKPLKKGESAGVDNIPSELVQVGGEAMINMLLIICNKLWQTGEWPTP